MKYRQGFKKMNIISRYDINSVVMNFVRFLIPLVRSDPSIAGIVIKHFLVFNSVHCLNHACYSFPLDLIYCKKLFSGKNKKYPLVQLAKLFRSKERERQVKKSIDFTGLIFKNTNNLNASMSNQVRPLQFKEGPSWP